MATTSITPEQDVVTAEIFIAAPPQRVFEALTDPKQAPQWWGQEGLYRITEYRGDVRVGGKWASVGMGADGKEFRVDGEYLEIDPPRRLVYTWIASFMGPQKTTVHWELEPRDVHGLQQSGPRKRGTGTLVKSGMKALLESLRLWLSAIRKDGCACSAGFRRLWK